MATKQLATELEFNYPAKRFGNSLLIHADSFEWMERAAPHSVHAIVTDPPYGVKEYDFDQLEKRTNGKGGIWRIPPTFDGHQRAPLPRFTALNERERQSLRRFFVKFGALANRVLRPGGHLFVASNAFLSQFVYGALVEGGLEFRCEIIRLVRTLRGGDRPKNAEEEYPGVSSLPRGCYEPWGLFRKPLPAGMKVSDCLREFETGGLRRRPCDLPFEDVIESERTPQAERKIVDHPSLKPQSFLRKIVHAALPLGKGRILDPFAGSGSTIAAAEALGLESIGIERVSNYFELACEAIPKLAGILCPDGSWWSEQSRLKTWRKPSENHQTKTRFGNYT
jgi:site-specific DNA-methyltransferase (adenine-specific)